MSFIDGGVVLITGGSGSLGQSLVSLLLKEYSPSAIRVFSRHEDLQVEMKRKFPDDRLRFMLGDVRDRDRLDALMNGVDYVIHCAALKHVGLGETNPQEFIKTNVVGSMNVLDVAAKHHVKKVIAISTDKVVDPMSLYGASKLMMERLWIDANSWSIPLTRFSVVRCGNFWGSRGSVIPLWQEQSSTGTITITDPDMTRYFIQLDDGAKFVLKALEMMRGGEIYVPKMKQWTIGTLASELWPNCKQEIIGANRIERVHERLFCEHEQPEENDTYYVIRRMK